MKKPNNFNSGALNEKIKYSISIIQGWYIQDLDKDQLDLLKRMRQLCLVNGKNFHVTLLIEQN